MKNIVGDGALGGAVGAVVGVGIVAVAIPLVGLSPLGPVAGGWFAANMGAGLVAGSWMSLAQSVVMTGSAYIMGAQGGAAVGVGIGVGVGAVRGMTPDKQPADSSASADKSDSSDVGVKTESDCSKGADSEHHLQEGDERL